MTTITATLFHQIPVQERAETGVTRKNKEELQRKEMTTETAADPLQGGDM